MFNVTIFISLINAIWNTGESTMNPVINVTWDFIVK